jgi:predicted kinase
MEAIIFVGIPGSGKSTFFLERFFATHVRINLDMLKTRHREMVMIAACIQARQSFVVDNTNITAAERARYIPLARQAGFRVVGYYFQSNLAESLQRNQQRSGKALIPRKGVVARYHQLEPPNLTEGFDELYYVKIDPKTGHFIVEEKNMDNFFQSN